MFISSLMTQNDITAGKLTDITHWENYIEMWQNINFFKYFKNSLIICSITTIIALCIATFAGYSIARFRFPGAGLFGTAVLSTQMIPGIMFLLPLFMMFTKIQKSIGISIVNTYHGIIITYSAFFIPFSIWILRGFFASIPKELEEAAQIDGCSPFGAFFRIILPLSSTGIIATGIYIFLMAWDELLFAWVLATTPDVATIPVGIRLYVGNYQNRYDLLMAAGVVSTIPILIMFFSLQKKFISGITAGAVKG
jgi:multiple sugar transport system permease protein